MTQRINQKVLNSAAKTVADRVLLLTQLKQTTFLKLWCAYFYNEKTFFIHIFRFSLTKCQSAYAWALDQLSTLKTRTHRGTHTIPAPHSQTCWFTHSFLYRSRTCVFCANKTLLCHFIVCQLTVLCSDAQSSPHALTSWTFRRAREGGRNCIQLLCMHLSV